MRKRKRLLASALASVLALQAFQGFAYGAITTYTQTFDNATVGTVIYGSERIIDSWGVSNGSENVKYIVVKSKASDESSVETASIEVEGIDSDAMGISDSEITVDDDINNEEALDTEVEEISSDADDIYTDDNENGSDKDVSDEESINEEEEITGTENENADTDYTEEEQDNSLTSEDDEVVDNGEGAVDEVDAVEEAKEVTMVASTKVGYDESDLYVKLVIDQSETESSGNVSIWRNFASSGFNDDLAIKFDLKVFDFNSTREVRFRNNGDTTHGNLVTISTEGEVMLLDQAIDSYILDNQWHTYTFNLVFDYPEAGYQTISAYIDGDLLTSKTYTDIKNVSYFDVFQKVASNSKISEMGFDNFAVTTIENYVNKKELAKMISRAQTVYDKGDGDNVSAGTALKAAITSAQEVYVDAEATTTEVDAEVLNLMYAIRTFSILTVENAKSFNELRESLVTNLGIIIAGETTNNTSDLTVAAEIATSEAAVVEALKTLITDSDRTQIFSDLSPTLESGKFSDAAFISNTMARIKTLALAYNQPGNSYYHSENLEAKILSAYDFVMTEWYCYGAEQTGNWWYWQIGALKSSMSVFLIMYDEISLEKRVEYIVAHEYFIDDDYATNQTGANRLDIGTYAAYLGVIAYDSEMISDATAAISKDLVYVESAPPGDGFYPDGSFIQHTNVAYTGSYGKDLLVQLIKYKIDFNDSPWALSAEYDDFIYEIVYNTFAPLIYNGKMMDMVNGRAIVRENSNIAIGYEVMNIMYKLSLVSDDENKQAIQSLLKEWISNDDFYYNDGDASSAIPANLRKFMMENNIEAAGEAIYNKAYPSMDRVVHTGEDYAFGLSMFSSRILSFEQTNGENLKGWYTGSGMTYIYNGDANQYTDDYWYAIDMYRLPGTTVTTAPRSTDRWTGEYTSQYDWVGSSSLLDLFGSAGMMISQWETGMTTVESTSSVKSSLSGKKSWFMFDDEIVALGAGITNTTSYNVETIIDNRMLADDGSWILSVNGNEVTSKTAIGDASFAYIDAGDAASSVGYYFPESANVNAMTETRTDYRSASDSSYTGDTQVTKNFATLWFDHGVNPEDASYQYVLLPSVSSNTIENYAENPDIVVLANTTQVQAAKDESIGVMGINFWENTETTVEYVTSYNQASVTLQEDGEYITLAISDPTMLQSSVTLALNGLELKEVVSSDSRITVKSTAGGTINIVVNTQNAYGESFEVKIKVADSDGESIDTSKLDSAIAAAKSTLDGYASNTGVTSSARAALNAAIAEAESVLTGASSQAEANEAVLILQAAVRAFEASVLDVLFKQDFNTATDGAVINNTTDRFESWGASNATGTKYLEFVSKDDDADDIYTKVVIDQTGSNFTGNINLWRNLASVSGLDSDLTISFDVKLSDTLSTRTIRFRSLNSDPEDPSATAALSTSHGNLIEFDTAGNAKLLGGVATKAVDSDWHNYTFELTFNSDTGKQAIIAYIDEKKVAEKEYADIQNVNYFDVIETASTSGNGNKSEIGFDNLYITRLEEKDAYITTVEGVTLTTAAGTAPELPETIVVHYSDDSSNNLEVTWDSFDEASYNSPGVFTVWGVVSGVDVCATVIVEAVEPDTYTVWFYSDGNLYSKITVTDGSSISSGLPEAPQLSGYTFSGWFSSQNGLGDEYTSSTVITEDTYLYAYWVAVEEDNDNNEDDDDNTDEDDDSNTDDSENNNTGDGNGGSSSGNSGNDNSSSSDDSSGGSSVNSSSSSNGGSTSVSTTTTAEVQTESATEVELPDDDVPLGNILVSEGGVKLAYSEEGYINGYPDGTVRPDEALSRGQFATILYLLVLDKEDGIENSSALADLNSDEYYYQAIMYLADKGILSGYPDGTFKPDNPITRAEVAAVLACFVDNSGDESELELSDISMHWAESSIRILVNEGVLSGYPDGTFKPDNQITRAEMITMLNHVLGVDVESVAEGKENRFSDLDESHWAYNEILAAIIE